MTLCPLESSSLLLPFDVFIIIPLRHFVNTIFQYFLFFLFADFTTLNFLNILYIYPSIHSLILKYLLIFKV